MWDKRSQQTRLGWGRGRGIRPGHKSSLRRSSGAHGSSSSSGSLSSGFPVRAQWSRASKRASNCGSTFSEYCATKPDKQLYSIYTCCRLLLLLLSAGAAPTAELATMQTASLARSERIVPKAPENTEGGGGEDGTSKWGKRSSELRRKSRPRHGRAQEGLQNPYNTTGRGAISKKKRKRKSAILVFFCVAKKQELKCQVSWLAGC